MVVRLLPLNSDYWCWRNETLTITVTAFISEILISSRRHRLCCTWNRDSKIGIAVFVAVNDYCGQSFGHCFIVCLSNTSVSGTPLGYPELRIMLFLVKRRKHLEHQAGGLKR